ncbi:hypothetical protein [Geodermatophilus marinus]|uniref:hypothetical protein n=1 Tax=Geodermatophilus sp. LHW52908 TaxID=2303986 RepID=UPI0011C0E11B|nr:hypothetical protein [Geodermatophilus sp. LHW52908]
MAVVVTIIGIQDRDGAVRVLTALRAKVATGPNIWAGGGYAGRLVAWAKTGPRRPSPSRSTRQRSPSAGGPVLLDPG